MNNTNKRNLTAMFAVLMAATLVVGTLATTITTITQTAFAFSKKKEGDENSKNGNTITIQKCKQAATQSGFDNTQEQDCKSTICTHPGENATCTQEGAVAAPQQTPTPITTTLRVIKIVNCLQGSNCSLPPNCTITVESTSNPQTFTCQSAIGNGVLVALQPGDEFSIVEEGFEGFNAASEGNCLGTIAEGQHLTCTITNTEARGG
jgi:hypothetical protein